MGNTLADLGEFGLIDCIHRLIEREGVKGPEGVELGIGDDTASITPRAGFQILVTCDSMVEGQHYLPRFASPADLGRRAMAINISDIGAMGGTPLYALVSLGLKAETPVRDVEEMYRGFLSELNPLGAVIIGGNITKSPKAGFIDVTLMGEAEGGKILRRSTAKAGDAILVTGYPGQSAAGLALLLQKGLEGDSLNHPLVAAYHRPAHRAREGRAVAQSGCATAMIDTSDGFIGDLGHICRDSRVGAEIFVDSLPVSGSLREAAATAGKEPYAMVLEASDDYELVITCPPENVDEIRSVVSAVSGVKVARVGRITERAGAVDLIFPDGARTSIPPSGWDHFRYGD